MSSSVVKKERAQELPRVEWKNAAAPGGVAAVRPRAAQPAPEELAQLEKQAYERGYRDGEAAGARQSLEQLQSAIQGFTHQAVALTQYKPRLRTEVERQVLELSLAVARKVLRRELAVDPNIVLAVVKGCLAELEHVEIYRLRLHPQDVPQVSAFFEQERRGSIELIPDSRISRGGALLETAQGQLDARLETQLVEIERGLADR